MFKMVNTRVVKREDGGASIVVLHLPAENGKEADEPGHHAVQIPKELIRGLVRELVRIDGGVRPVDYEGVAGFECGYCGDCLFWKEVTMGSTRALGVCARFTDNEHCYGKVLLDPEHGGGVLFTCLASFGCEAWEGK